MEKNISVETDKLNELGSKASNIIQKNAEAVGTLKMIDAILHEIEDHTNRDMLWSLRNAIRNIESAIDDAADISDTVEEFKGMN